MMNTKRKPDDNNTAEEVKKNKKSVNKKMKMEKKCII